MRAATDLGMASVVVVGGTETDGAAGLMGAAGLAGVLEDVVTGLADAASRVGAAALLGAAGRMETDGGVGAAPKVGAAECVDTAIK